MDVIYIHSPITYSIASQLIRDGVIRDPLVICGRSITWQGPHIAVHDDGIWNSERVRDILVELTAAIPAGVSRLDFYVPHTAYLLGKLLKLSPLCGTICYIEEGNTSCDPTLAEDHENLRIHEDILLRLLQQHPAVMARFRLDAALISRINGLPAIWFDDRHPKYGGAYRVSGEAFPTLRKVTTITPQPTHCLLNGERNWLCFLPNIVNLVASHGAGSNATQTILHGLVVAMRAISAMVRHASGELVIKFHPVDEANLSDDFKGELFSFGQSYADFAVRNGIDAQLEPSLFNLGHFIVVNESAASRYVELFRGSERLINVALD